MMSLKPPHRPDPDSWLKIIASAYALFDDARSRGFGDPPFSLGGGTVLMLRFKHRLSIDIDLFGYDAQWLSVLSPRLNEKAASLATSYTEQANTIKIVMPHGDIDFVIAGDVAVPVERSKLVLAGREIMVDPTAEILAKKLFYRAATFKPRDVYDLSAAIDLAPDSALRAVKAAVSKQALLLRRIGELETMGETALLGQILPYQGPLLHAAGMLAKVKDFILTRMQSSNPSDDRDGSI